MSVCMFRYVETAQHLLSTSSSAHRFTKDSTPHNLTQIFSLWLPLCGESLLQLSFLFYASLYTLTFRKIASFDVPDSF